jgi:hypothetical protein
MDTEQQVEVTVEIAVAARRATIERRLAVIISRRLQAQGPGCVARKQRNERRLTDSDSESNTDPDNEELALPQAEDRKFAAQKTNVARKKYQEIPKQ